MEVGKPQKRGGHEYDEKKCDGVIMDESNFG
jgi:hypothetical protein